ncbi:hypothetical protein KRP22_014289 [Phytophthora ramorum]|nr:hypothetical protein KRP22_9111 [Phytophthora ramorum]
MAFHEALALVETSDGIDRDSATFPPLAEIDKLLDTMLEYLPEEAKSHGKGKTQGPTTKKGERTTRVRSPASSSTVLQRRRRAEILSLRQQATELQKALDQILSGGEANPAILTLNAKTYADAKARGQRLSRWHRCALEQYEMRNKSQELNRQLKKILSQQRNTSSSLRRILRRQSLVQDMKYLMKHESPEHLFGPLADNDVSRSMAQLESAVENMYQYATPQFEVGSTPALSSPVQTSYSEQRKGDVVEFVVSTPMSCSMANASNVMWNYHNNQTPENMPNVFHNMETLTMQHLEDTLQFDKLHYVRKFSESDKITFACSDILLLRSKGLRFLLKGYITFMPLPADPLHTCVVHSVFKVHCDNEAGQQSAFANGVALGSLSKYVRLCWQSEQSRLVDETTRIPR